MRLKERNDECEPLFFFLVWYFLIGIRGRFDGLGIEEVGNNMKIENLPI